MHKYVFISGIYEIVLKILNFFEAAITVFSTEWL